MIRRREMYMVFFLALYNSVSTFLKESAKKSHGGRRPSPIIHKRVVKKESISVQWRQIA